MDLDKLDRLEAVLRACLFVECTNEEATAAEALTAAMRLFANTLAAYVSADDATPLAMRSDIEAHGHNAVTMAMARLRLLGNTEEDDAIPEQ
jgi:hypothetical protein